MMCQPLQPLQEAAAFLWWQVVVQQQLLPGQEQQVDAAQWNENRQQGCEGSAIP